MDEDFLNNQDNTQELNEGGKQGRMFALFLRQPFANDLASGNKTIEIRSKTTRYRGQMLICSTQKWWYKDMMPACCVGIAELYDIKPLSQLTLDDWRQTRVPVSRRKDIKGGFAWFFRDCKRIVEFPASSKNKIAFIDFNKGDIFPYPENVKLDVDLTKTIP